MQSPIMNTCMKVYKEKYGNEPKALCQFLNMIFAIPNGVQRMSDSMPGLVETSNNLANFIAENGEMSAKCLLRSSVNSAKEALGEKMVAIAELAD